MFSFTGSPGLSRTTSYKAVLPFYAYAALAFLTATFLLLFSATDFTTHYFHPHLLAITHIMVLGWGTMIVLGASHQLVPVLIESTLYSEPLASVSFVLAAAGIPLLSYGFYVFNMGWPAMWGGSLMILAILAYCINLGMSMIKSKAENVHAIFVFTATLWLLCTASVGLVLVYNFSYPLLSANSADYLSLHAHMGIVGWFLLMIIGIGSRLIPMFLLSKYNNPRLLWWILGLINGGLLAFVFIYLYGQDPWLWTLAVLPVIAAISLFAKHCFSSYQQRIRKKVDEQMKISLLSVMVMLLPVLLLAGIMVVLAVTPGEPVRLITTYGFLVIFGWITSIILGMTFKTLPFIVWNKVYHQKAGQGKVPNPKDLFSAGIFNWMSMFYLIGCLLFTMGILTRYLALLQTGALILLLAAVLYNWNVLKLLTHKPVV